MLDVINRNACNTLAVRKPHRQGLLAVVVAGVALLGATAASADTPTWLTAGNGGNWNLPANWSTAAVPSTASDVFFVNNTANSTLASVLSDTLTINSLTYRGYPSNTNSIAYHLTTINPGATLAIHNTTGGDVLLISPSALARSLSATIGGGGSLVIDSTATTSVFRVSDDYATSTSYSATSSLDLTGLGNLDVAVSLFALGTDSAGSPKGYRNSQVLSLPTGAASQATIRAATLAIVGGASSGSYNPASTMNLGKSTTIYADVIKVGGATDSGAILRFNPAADFTGSLTIAGRTADASPDLTVGIGSYSGNASAPTVLLDLSTNAAVGGLHLSFNTVTIGAGAYPALFNFAAASDTTSVMTIASLVLGNNIVGSASGTLALNGGMTRITGAVAIGAAGNGSGLLSLHNSANMTAGAGGITLGGANSTGAITIADAAVLLVGSGGIASNASGTGQSAITVSGGTLALSDGNLGSAAAPLGTLAYIGGSITKPGNIYVKTYTGSAAPRSLTMISDTLAITSAVPGGTLSDPGLSLSLRSGALSLNNTATTDTFAMNGLTLNGATLNFDIGAGWADRVALSGTGTLAVSGVSTVNLTSTGVLSSTIIPVISYKGDFSHEAGSADLAAYFNVAAPAGATGYTFSLASSAGELDLIVMSTQGWTGSSGSDWFNDGNWNLPSSNRIPNAAGAVATFGDGASHTVAVNGLPTVGALMINSTAGYSISGVNAITFRQSGSGPAFLSVAGASHTLDVPLVLASNLNVTILSELVLTQPVSGIGTLTKYGGGTLRITAPNVLQIPTLTLNAGTVDLSGQASLLGGLAGSGGILNFRNGSLTIGANSVNGTFAGVIMGTGSITKVGTGALGLTGSSAFVGNVTVTNGTLALGRDEALGNAANQLIFDGGSPTFSGTLTLQATDDDPVLAATRIITLNNTTQFDSSLHTLTIAGPIIGSGGLVKINSGTLFLTSASNTFGGGTTLNAGTLNFNALQNFGAGGFILNGGTMQWAQDLATPPDITARSVNLAGRVGFDPGNSDVTLAGSITGTGSFEKVGTGILTIAGSNTYAGGTTISGGTLAFTSGGFVQGAIVDNATLALNFPGGGVFGISVSGSGGLVKNYNSTVTLSVSNSFTGVTSITAGTLRLSNASALSGSTVQLDQNAGRLDVTGVNAILGGLQGNGSLELQGMFVSVGNNNQTTTFSGSLTDTGAGAFRKIGSGTLRLTGAGLGTLPSLTSLYFSGGYLDLNGDSQTSSAKIIFDGGFLTNGTLLKPGGGAYEAQSGGVAATGRLAGTVGLSKTGTGVFTLGGPNDYAGGTTISGGTLQLTGTAPTSWLGTGPITFLGGTLDATAAGDYQTLPNDLIVSAGKTGTLKQQFRSTFTGALTGAGSLAVVVGSTTGSMAGDWSSFTGALAISGGDFRITNTAGYPQVAINLASGARLYNGAALPAAGATMEIGELSGAGTLGSGLGAAQTMTWIVGGRNTDATFTGLIANTGSWSSSGAGKAAIVKTGSGLWMLGGSNTYAGGTTVNQGLLVFASASARPSGDLLQLNATVVGSNTFGGKVVVRGDAARLTNYRAQLAVSYATGRWEGDGLIATATARVDTGLATQGIGYMTGDAYLALHGGSGDGFQDHFTVASTDLLLRYTYLGDADLSGRITLDDYAQVDAAFLLQISNPMWWNGDFNYDGTVDYRDYALIDAAFMLQAAAGPLAADEVARHSAWFGDPYDAAFQAALAAEPVAVPEPASLALLTLGAAALRRRRR